MKKQHIRLLSLVLAVLLAGCDKFLDIKPTGSVIPTTLNEYRALWANTYNSVPAARGMASFCSDEMYISRESDLNSYGAIERWEGTTTSSFTTPFEWAKYYSVLFTANYIIEHYEEITEATEKEIDQLVGECYLMRAYMHFVLVNLYGEPYTKAGAPDTKSVPLKLDCNLEDQLFRSTVNEVYASVLSDFNMAGQLLNVEQWDDVTLSYRFTSTCVPALLSRVYLYMGDWENAYKYAEEALALKHQLENFNAEGFLLPNNYKSVEAINPLEFTMNSNYNGATSASSYLLSLYAEGDLRKDAYFAPPTEKEGRKSIKGGSSEFRCTIRTGELYLNSAEAAARSNKLDEARARLLQLMENRYAPEAYTLKETSVKAMNQTQLIEEIMNERARELAFEGHRWFDLRRTTRPRIEKMLDGKSYVLSQDDARYTIQIPTEAVAANPNLKN